jgi:ubiquinone biosynthesis protein COQ9
VLSVAVTDEDSAASLISYKRAASAELSYSIKRALASSIYKGTSLRELRDFLLSYKVYFDAIKEQLTRRRIIVAALYIRDKALR